MAKEEKINDDDLVREAIATAPDVTFQDTGEKPPLDAKEAAGATVDEADFPASEKNGRLLALALKQWDREKRLDPAQIEAGEEIGSEGFGAINALNIPRGAKLSITAALLFLSVVPMGLELFNILNIKEEKNKNEHDGNSFIS